MIDHSVRFKLDGKPLTPTSTVKYLGGLLDNHILWSKQTNHVTKKLNQDIGILSKLRNNTSNKTLKITYYLPFSFIFPPTVRISTMGAYKPSQPKKEIDTTEQSLKKNFI